MTSNSLTLTACFAFASVSLAQMPPNLLVSFSGVEQTLSDSGGTGLKNIFPNEMALVDFGTCPTLSAEKWMPRSCIHVMAGDENGDGEYWNAGVFGSVDAVLTHRHSTGGGLDDNQRTVYWSVSAPMGGAVSAQPFRTGDVACIVSNGIVDGQVSYFMSQEQFNIALGRPLNAPLDIDAVAWEPNFGIFFSIDNDRMASTACGPVLVQDGDVICIPPAAISYTSDSRIASVLPSSAVVIYTEAQMDAFTVNAFVADNMGNCVSSAKDVEGLEIDPLALAGAVVVCGGMMVNVPTLLYSTETGSGGSILTTQAGGQIYSAPCGLMGEVCGGGPTLGDKIGLHVPAAGPGIPSHVTSIGYTDACTYVLEADTPVMPVSATGAPAGASQIQYNSPFALNVMLVELVGPIVPHAIVGLPFSPTCFPDLYAPSILSYRLFPVGFGTVPMPALPIGFVGKVLFQSAGFGSGSLELSTPTIVDVK
jgi:hypothetical protein